MVLVADKAVRVEIDADFAGRGGDEKRRIRFVSACGEKRLKMSLVRSNSAPAPAARQQAARGWRIRCALLDQARDRLRRLPAVGEDNDTAVCAFRHFDRAGRHRFRKFVLRRFAQRQLLARCKALKRALVPLDIPLLESKCAPNRVAPGRREGSRPETRDRRDRIEDRDTAQQSLKRRNEVRLIEQIQESAPSRPACIGRIRRETP